MELISAPGNWNPCYNKRGDVVFVDDINGDNELVNISWIGAPGLSQQEAFGFDAEDLVVQIIVPSSDLTPWPGSYIQIIGTDNYDGIYLVLEMAEANNTWFKLQGSPDFPVEVSGQSRLYYNNMRLYCELSIENTYTVKFRTDASANGQYIANINDYLKDYFKFQLSAPQQGSFNTFSTTIRARLRWASEYDRVDRVWNGTQFVYVKSRIKTPLSSSFVNAIVVNAALQYVTAFNTGALTAYVVGPTSVPSTRFATYRPRDTYVGEDQDLFITTLRDQSDHTPQGVVTAYSGDGTALQSIPVSVNEPVGYEWPHHTLWNIGTAAINLPSATSYYTFQVNIGGVRRTELMTVRIKPKCGDLSVMWKNEFGAPEIVNMFGVSEQTLGVDYQTAGTSDIVNVTNPGNYIKRSSESPYRIGLNTGLINTEHAKWLLSLGRTTEVFVKLNGLWQPIIITPQQLGPVSSNNRTHNLTFEAEIPFTVAQISNQTQ